MLKKKAVLFVDGFNLYHSINNQRMNKYKWLNLKALGEQFITSTEELDMVYYFTAYSWRPDKQKRHENYIRLLRSSGCSVIFGRFQEKPKTSFYMCDKKCIPPHNSRPKAPCGKTFLSHEEKLTDVNIAVNIIKACVLGECDSVYLLSGDNDMIPALETAKQLCPQVKIRVIFPINAQAKNLMNVCQRNSFKYMTINEHHLKKALFPETVTIEKMSFTKPASWI